MAHNLPNKVEAYSEHLRPSRLAYLVNSRPNQILLVGQVGPHLEVWVEDLVEVASEVDSEVDLEVD